ncbi:MAG TPA: hypothetical protein VLL05_12035 [Terriglobales bacterium]|nr:hypothetical protein [Terriglobales bacterium]
MQQTKTRFIALALLLFIGSMNMFAQSAAQRALNQKKLPLSVLRNSRVKSPSHDKFAAFGKNKANAGLKTAATVGLPGVDSVVNWSDSFTSPGYDFFGNPQSVWPYTMVGTPPESGRPVNINAPVIPVTVDLLAADGSVAVTFATGRTIVNNMVNSPVFQPWIYTNGIGQFNDQMFRAEFWNRIHHGDDANNWHVTISPNVKRGRRMQIPWGSWFVATDNNNNPVAALVEGNAFGAALFPPTFPVTNDTVIGAAELAGDMTTKDISSLLFNNVYLYDGTPDNCCVLGFHSYDFEPGVPSNGNRERRYVMMYASWIDPGLFIGGFEDVTAYSHEMSETYNDPFVDNQTPWWLSSDPIFGGLCQDNLETGDVVEVLSGNPVYPVPMHNRTYHPSNEALFSWFAFESPSTARLRAYSFPDETTVMSLSPGPLLPGCVPAP